MRWVGAYQESGLPVSPHLPPSGIPAIDLGGGHAAVAATLASADPEDPRARVNLTVVDLERPTSAAYRQVVLLPAMSDIYPESEYLHGDELAGEYVAILGTCRMGDGDLAVVYGNNSGAGLRLARLVWSGSTFSLGGAVALAEAGTAWDSSSSSTIIPKYIGYSRVGDIYNETGRGILDAGRLAIHRISSRRILITMYAPGATASASRLSWRFFQLAGNGFQPAGPWNFGPSPLDVFPSTVAALGMGGSRVAFVVMAGGVGGACILDASTGTVQPVDLGVGFTPVRATAPFRVADGVEFVVAGETGAAQAVRIRASGEVSLADVVPTLFDPERVALREIGPRLDGVIGVPSRTDWSQVVLPGAAFVFGQPRFLFETSTEPDGFEFTAVALRGGSATSRGHLDAASWGFPSEGLVGPWDHVLVTDHHLVAWSPSSLADGRAFLVFRHVDMPNTLREGRQTQGGYFA